VARPARTPIRKVFCFFSSEKKTFPFFFIGANAMKATWNGATIAESNDIVTVEGNAYFPADSVRKDHIKPSDHHSVCPWKGTASYYSVVVDGKENANAAWYYPAPKDAAKEITGRVAFWKGVQVS
jgi:uncharacterized protein (DUF427 family)